MTSTASYLEQRAHAARAASRVLATSGRGPRDAAVLEIARLLEAEQAPILEANHLDIRNAQDAGADDYFVERLTLNHTRLQGMADDTRRVAALDDPIGEMFDARTLPNGLRIGRRRVPLGVVACVYESRPNVTVDIAALCLKSANASILRGGKEARHTNEALGQLISRSVEAAGLPVDAVQVISDPDRALVDELLGMSGAIDLLIPRGGKSLIEHVRTHATMPVVAGGIGVVHIYVDAAADLGMAIDIVDNAKRRRYSICNAVDTLLVHVSVAPRFLERLGEQWAGKVTVLADDRAYSLLAPRGGGLALERAMPADWDTEHLALRCGVRIVDSIDEAIAHIEQHGSGHSEAIVTEDYSNAMRFLDEVDSAAVYVNASTQFTDGAQFGLGAEVAISTGKAHARGPVGLRELTSYKWVILGKGQVRPL
jgi:glutamate-5-semialdehyde dehydrogenase